MRIDRRVLVTGATGVLGWNICRYLVGNCASLSGTFRRSEALLEGVDFMRLPLEDTADVRRFIAGRRYDVVIHSAAMTSPDECEKSPELAWRVNVEATQAIVEGLQGGELLIYVSTDLVFDGLKGWYREDDLPNPTNLYGETKLEAEKVVRQRPSSVVVRVAKLFSNGSPFHACFTNWMIDRFEAGQRVTLFRDQYRTPVFARDIARGFERLMLEPPQKNLYHLGGAERLSRLQFGRILAETFRYEQSLIEPIRFADSGLVKRGGDCSLDSTRFCSEYGFSQTETDVALRDIFEERVCEGRAGP